MSLKERMKVWNSIISSSSYQIVPNILNYSSIEWFFMIITTIHSTQRIVCKNTDWSNICFLGSNNLYSYSGLSENSWCIHLTIVWKMKTIRPVTKQSTLIQYDWKSSSLILDIFVLVMHSMKINYGYDETLNNLASSNPVLYRWSP